MNQVRKTRVRTFYPADPVGIVPGGVDTFIRGLIKFAPEDIEFSLVGMTTDLRNRPIGRWTACALGGRRFDFFPVVKMGDAGSRTRIPLSARFTYGAARFASACRGNFDVYEFHRVEPALLYLSDVRPKNMFFHQDMAVIKTESKADILWKWMPGIYFAIERRIAHSLASAWCVHEQGAASLRKRYSFLAEHIRFVPTWVDVDVFYPLPVDRRAATRSSLEQELQLVAGGFRMISVGRLDSQKDPHLLLSAAIRLASQVQGMELLLVGDGVMRRELEVRVASAGLGSRIRFVGLKSAAEITRLLHASDCFVLSSAYEGMPMALLEALGAGIPVVSTPVGEVKRVVIDSVNGVVARDCSEDALVEAILKVARREGDFSTVECVRSIERYVPAIVLEPVYENYRSLGRLRHDRA